MFGENTIIGKMAKGEYPEKEVTTAYGVFKIKFPDADDKVTIENRKADALGGRPLNQFAFNYQSMLERDMTLSVVIASYPANFPEKWKDRGFMQFEDVEVKNSLYEEFSTFLQGIQKEISTESKS